MNKQNSKKHNSKQKTIAVIALIVTVLLAICVTFAWYTNRINGMKGIVKLGGFNYAVTLYDIDPNDYSVINDPVAKTYTSETKDDTTFADVTFQLKDFANESVKYQVVKVTNNSGFGIKAYEYLTFGTLSEAQKTLSNYFYFKPFKLSNNATVFPDFPTTVTKASLQEYFTQHTAYLPNAAAIASVDTDWTFGNLNNNSVALERNAIANNATEYYLLAYTMRGTTDPQIHSTEGFDLTPVIAIGQANGPVPQTSGSAGISYADSWYELKSAIAAANPGDTVYLTGNVTGPDNAGLYIDNDINLNLNGYSLTIAGDLVFNYNQKANRNLTVPAASILTVKGDMRVSSLGAFSVNGSGASKNIFLGERVTVNNVTTVRKGNLYVNCGLAVDQKTRVATGLPEEQNLIAVTDDVIVEDSGFNLNNVIIQKLTVSNSENAILTVNGSNTMVRIGSGATIASLITESGLDDIYVANYGTITNLNLENVEFDSRDYDCGLYVVNYNTVSGIALPQDAEGYKTEGTSYNTRIKDAEGAVTSFKTQIIETGSFKVADVEPFSSSTVEQSEVKDLGGGVYEVYLRNTSLNTDSQAESISGLFAQYNKNPLNCTELRMITTNAITLKTSQFYDIRDKFKNLNTIDFTRCAVADNTIPANAFNASVSSAENKIIDLQNVRLPLTEVQIGAAAFKGTNIEKITLAANVTNIGDEALHTETNLEVTWDNSDSSMLATFILQGAFDKSKTIIFMDAGVVQDAYLNSAFTDEWKMCMYENYDFKSSDYYCKYVRDGSSNDDCEIIYYAGTIANKANTDLVPNQLNDPITNNIYTVTGIKRHAFRKAIYKDGGATSGGVLVNLTNCTRVENDAFKGNLTIQVLKLGKVYSIGSSAFEGNSIIYSDARPNTFSGMLELGSRAFAKTTISGGILDLHGVSNNKYSPDDNAFNNLLFIGSYNNQNAVLNLQNVSIIRSSLTSGAKIHADILLNHVETIADGAFSGAIYADDDTNPTNIVDARDVRVIGEKAFFGIQCKTLYLGTHDATLKDDRHPYTSIIGSTSGTHIQTLVLDGKFLTTDEPAIASDESSEVVRIGTLQLTSNTTEIPKYAFATNGTVSGGLFTDLNLSINDVKTYEEVSGGTEYATFDIGDYAFRGVSFSSTEKDFEGVVNIGERAFESSSIVNLNLGNSIDTIESENFIWHCDNLRHLWIERMVPSGETVPIDPDTGKKDYSDYMVKLGTGNVPANPKISSTGTKIGTDNSPFRIHVNIDLTIPYISDAVWSGWKDYFEALVYEYSNDSNSIWYYNIIDPYADDPETRGCHIVGWKLKNTWALDGDDQLVIEVPDVIYTANGDYNVTAFGTDEDIFAEVEDNDQIPGIYLIMPFAYVKTFNPKSLQSPKIAGVECDSSDGIFTLENDVLYKNGSNTVGNDQARELYKVFPFATSGDTFTVPYDVYKIKSGAFSGTSDITTIDIESGSFLTFIESGAFDNTNIKTFDFRNIPLDNSFVNLIFVEEDAFGPVREQVLDPATGHYYYKANTDIAIIIPDDLADDLLYPQDSAYTMYRDYGVLYSATEWEEENGSSLPDKTDGNKTAQGSLKQNVADVTVSGITYHIMNSDTAYMGTTYKSSKTKFVAVVTGLNAQTSSSSVVIIPSTISVKGISYEVVGITDNAFGKNDVLETLVLPNKNVAYSSDAFAGCSKLGIIQYNDIVAYTESAKNNVASLPVQSTKSLLESSTDESED